MINAAGQWGKISDWMIMSDVDGTLVTKGDVMPPRNRDAINRFVARGGRFAIASGRSFPRIAHFFEEININAPCVIFNGGAIYDKGAGQYQMELLLPDIAKPYIDVLDQAPFPHGLGVVTRQNYYCVGADTHLMDELFTARRQPHLQVNHWQDLEAGWFKVLLIVPSLYQEEAMKFVTSKSFPGVRFTAAEPGLLEMLPEKSSKGYALEWFMAQTGLKRERLAVVGDFYNDIEMLDLAGFSAVPVEAPEDVKTHAGFITCPCSEGAVADVIEYLEARCQ